MDCDVHPGIPDGIKPALRYMTIPWRERLAALSGSIECRGAAAKDVIANVLPTESDQALLVPLVRLNAWSDALMASVVASAINDYFVNEWLPLDSRFRLALVLPPQSPSHTCEEIRKHASNPQVKAATIPLLSILLGDAQYQPVFAALEENDLPLVVHPTGAEGLYSGAPELAGGHTFARSERRILVPQIAQSNLNSMICQGVFERFPKARVIFSGFGAGWLTPLIWRMDMDWRRLRIETPWVKRLPSDYVVSNVFVTVTGSHEIDEAFPAKSALAERLRAKMLFGSHYDRADETRSQSSRHPDMRSAEALAFSTVPAEA